MSYQSGYQNTGIKQREAKALKDKIKSLTLENKRLISQLTEAKQTVEELRSTHEDMTSIYAQCSFSYPMLYVYLKTTFKNVFAEKHGKRYDGLEDFAALISLYSEKLSYILQKALILPHYKTSKKYRLKALEEIGINESIFDGSSQNVANIVNLQSYPQERIRSILAIDACYVTPYVCVDKQCNIIGLVKQTPMTETEAQSLVDNENNFNKFLSNNKNNIIQAEFVFMVAPINPDLHAFPVCCIPSNSGAATNDIDTIILNLKQSLENSNIDIIGIGTDGDHQYNKYSRHLIEYIISDYKQLYSDTFVNFISSHEMLFHFSDPFHLTKRDRYHKLRNKTFNCSPIYKKEIRDTNNLKRAGIQEYILDDEKARKMEDDLAQKFFAPEILLNIYNNRDIPLLTCMLPSSLLLDSIHSKDLSKLERIEELLFGASIVYLYYFHQESILQNLSKKTSPTKKDFKTQICFDQQWCCEYISIAFSIAHVLLTDEKVNLGSLGSHLIEHLFGNIRRMSKGNDTHKQFMHSLQCYMVESELCKRCGIENNNTSRRHDSGAIVEDSNFDKEICFLTYLQAAKRLMNNFVQFPEGDLFVMIGVDKEKMTLDECRDILPRFLELRRSKISTKSIGKVSTGGLCNARKWKAADQIIKY